MSHKLTFVGKMTLLAIAASVMLIIAGCKKQPTILQKTCPVMGSPIDKNIFVEYKGKKVYFCCKACPEKFLADPNKYIAKLPQFQQ